MMDMTREIIKDAKVCMSCMVEQICKKGHLQGMAISLQQDQFTMLATLSCSDQWHHAA
jgi:hypothetical protein